MATSEYYNSHHPLPLPPPPSHDPHGFYPQPSQPYLSYQADQSSSTHDQGPSYFHQPQSRYPHYDEYGNDHHHQIQHQDFQPTSSSHEYHSSPPHEQLPQSPSGRQVVIRRPLPRGPESPSSHPSRPNTKGRGFSFRSDRSHEKKVVETHAEKEAKRPHGKADPTLAISEAEPSTVAAMITEPTYTPLRELEHKDDLGNRIAEPDRSNPTRSRWERPLDTIRGFERAIEAENNRKSVYLQSDASSVAWNRLSGYYAQDNRTTHPRDSSYRNSIRPESTQFELVPPVPRSSYYGDGVGDNGPRAQGAWGPRASRQRVPRGYSDAHYQPNSTEQQPVYGLQHKDRSYETVTSAAASGTSADQAGYQTDPTSSDNSSIDRTSPAKPTAPVNDYGIGFTQPAQYTQDSFSVSPTAQPSSSPPLPAQIQSNEVVAAPPLQKRLSILRRVSTVGSQKDGDGKRMSWLKRRFSKNA